MRLFVQRTIRKSIALYQMTETSSSVNLHSLEGKKQEMPEHTSNLETVISLAQDLRTRLHSIITISVETDRAAIENVVVRSDVHCMLTEIISTARMHLHMAYTMSELSQLVVHHVCTMLARLIQQIQEVFLLDSIQDARWFAIFRPSRMPLAELATSFELLRCRYSRLLTILSAQPPTQTISPDPDHHSDNASSNSHSETTTLEDVPLDD